MTLSDYLSRYPKSRERSHQIDILARALHVSSPAIRHWCHGRRRPNPSHTLQLEVLTQGAVTRYELRPDIYGEKPINNQEEKNHD